MLLKRELVSLSCCFTAATATNPATLRLVPSAAFWIHRRRPTIISRSSGTPSTLLVCSMSTTTPSLSTVITSPPYWNREETPKSSFSGPILQPARILSLADPNDPNNTPLHVDPLPEGATLLAVGTSLEQFSTTTTDATTTIEQLKAAEPNVLFVSYSKARQPLAEVLQTFPSIQWVHTRSAGIDFCTSPTLIEYSQAGKIQVTNAKGCFSSTLAEYTMMACSYFAKDLPRLLQQKHDSKWNQYPILELRGATLGVVGFGDIGRSAAKLAKAYGMKVIALKRNPDQMVVLGGNGNDRPRPLADKVYGTDALNQLFAESDYILCAAPLTPETEKMIGKEQFDHAKKGAVFINVGRGPIVDEDALIDALKDGRLKGAGLDVTAIEPLPKDSELWKLENVLLSPHNMDMTQTFMKESTQFFVEENLPRFLYGQTLLNPVHPAAGY